MVSFKDINSLFTSKNLTLGSVESYTGGLYASETTSISGASKFYKGALVTYYTEEKIKLLGIKRCKVNKFGVVSKEIAYDMAKFGKDKLDVDVCISFTGNAGPSAMENKPCGLVYIGFAIKNEVFVEELHLTGTREEIRKQSLDFANEYVFKKLN